MTLPYSRFPLDRALSGIKRPATRTSPGARRTGTGSRADAGDGRRRPSGTGPGAGRLPRSRPRAAADVLDDLSRGARRRGRLEEPRIRQAAAAGVPQVLTFGHTRGGNRKLWVERFKQLGPIARDHGVTIVVKQHGGETGTGAACAEIVREVDDDGDQGQLRRRQRDGLPRRRPDPGPHAPAPTRCAVSASRTTATSPKDEDCGPGFGEIDHYRLLAPGRVHRPRRCRSAARTSSPPLVPRPAEPEGVDALARRAREFLEVVTQGLQS